MKSLWEFILESTDVRQQYLDKIEDALIDASYKYAYSLSASRDKDMLREKSSLIYIKRSVSLSKDIFKFNFDNMNSTQYGVITVYETKTNKQMYMKCELFDFLKDDVYIIFDKVLNNDIIVELSDFLALSKKADSSHIIQGKYTLL